MARSKKKDKKKKKGRKRGTTFGGASTGRQHAPTPEEMAAIAYVTGLSRNEPPKKDTKGGGAESVPQVWIPGTPANPGVRTPPVDPFLTPEQQMGKLTLERDFELALKDIDDELKRMKFDVDYQIRESDKEAEVKSAGVTDDMIGRGLFQSSVRDAELTDVAAANALRKGFLSDRLSIEETRGIERKKILRDNFDALKNAITQQMVQNATDVGKEQPPWKVEPTPGTEGRWAPAGSSPGGAPANPHSINNPLPSSLSPEQAAMVWAAAAGIKPQPGPTGTGRTQQPTTGRRRRGGRRGRGRRR